jgi:hypothetical protein
MNFVIRLHPKTLKYDAFQYNEPGPLPSIVDPKKPEEAKDGGVPESKESRSEKPEIP